MQFFDDKQEVMDVVITPYGKHLLSTGRFKPEYYAFFDDDILYDTNWVTGSTTAEVQNEIEPRIQEGTPRMKQPSVHLGVETAIDARNELIREALDTAGFLGTGSNAQYVAQDTHTYKIYNQENLQFYSDKFRFLPRPLGRSEQNSDNLPAWNISMMKGEISSSQDFLAAPVTDTTRGTPGFIENIPQINITLNYRAYVSEIGSVDAWAAEDVTVDYGSTTFPVPTDPNIESIASTEIPDVFPPGTVQDIASQIYGDGTYFTLENGKIILEITEENVQFKKENFDVQVFVSSSVFPEVDGNLQQLFFTNDVSNVQSDEVEKYLTIRVDKGIDDARLTPSVGAPNSLTTDSATTNVVSTREFLLRDLYDPEEDICE